MLAFLRFNPGQHAAQVLASWQAAVAGAPDELTTLVDLTIAPAAPFLPEDLHGTKVAIVSVCWAGPLEEGEEVVRPLRALGTPTACELHVHQLGGAMARTADGATAFSQRQPPYLINCIARTPTEGFEAEASRRQGALRSRQPVPLQPQHPPRPGRMTAATWNTGP